MAVQKFWIASLLQRKSDNLGAAGCTFTEASYPAGDYGGPTSYPPDGPSPCSPNCYQGWHGGGVAPAEAKTAAAVSRYRARAWRDDDQQ